MSKKVMGHSGMLLNYPDTAVEKPCEGECTLLWQQAGLEYPNGTNGMLSPSSFLASICMAEITAKYACFYSEHRQWDVVSVEPPSNIFPPSELY
jgi:hypothetical protein